MSHAIRSLLWRALVLAVLAPVAPVPAASAADAAPGGAGATVAGRLVRMQTAVGVADAVVRLDGVELSALTSASGHFAIPGVPPGEYTVSVYHQREWYAYVGVVRVPAGTGPGATIDVDVELPVPAAGLRENVVVTGSRGPSTLRETPEALTVLESADLRRYAASDLADVLRAVAGLHVYAAGGNPADQAVNVRGFTGGGENDYLLVLVDGVRINDFNNGRVDWREIPLSEIERVEILRGPVSALYGDTAVGGVVQIFTRGTEGPALAGRLTGGSHGELGAAFRFGQPVGHLHYRGAIRYDRGDGFRDNGEWEDVQARLRFGREDPQKAWSFQLWVRSDEHENPGVLPAALAESDPETSLPEFAFDGLRRERVSLTWQDRRPVGPRWELDSQASVRLQDDELTETILGSTAERLFSGTLLWGEIRGRRTYGRDDQWRLTTGVEAYGGLYDSEYYDVLSDGSRGPLTADGEGTRLGGGLYAQVEWQALYNLQVTGGLRLDAVEDTFEETLGDSDLDTGNEAVSPRIGVLWTPADSISLWANAGRSFKAPTPFQLFDQRRFFGMLITNPNLEPQFGNSVSVGYRHALGDRYSVEATLYQLDLEDEIGFDAANFQTANIAESRHRGYELSATGSYGENWTGRLAWTLTDAQVRSGDNAGNRIEQVPRYTTSAGLGWARGLWSASAFLRDARGVYIDSANTLPLDAYRTVDLSVEREFPFGLQARLEMFNAFDETYATWGFASPLDGSPQLYPGLERTVRLSVRYHPNWVR